MIDKFDWLITSKYKQCVSHALINDLIVRVFCCILPKALIFLRVLRGLEISHIRTVSIKVLVVMLFLPVLM